MLKGKALPWSDPNGKGTLPAPGRFDGIGALDSAGVAPLGGGDAEQFTGLVQVTDLADHGLLLW